MSEMQAEEIVRRLERLGIMVTVADDRLKLKPGSRVPAELVEQVRARKQEVMEYIRTRYLPNSRRFNLKFPDGRNAAEEELNEISHEVEATGYCLLWSTELEDFVAFHRAEFDVTKIPPGFVPYSEDELWHLFGHPGDEISMEALRLVHDAKKKGARVIGIQEDDSE